MILNTFSSTWEHIWKKDKMEQLWGVTDSYLLKLSLEMTMFESLLPKKRLAPACCLRDAIFPESLFIYLFFYHSCHGYILDILFCLPNHKLQDHLKEVPVKIWACPCHRCIIGSVCVWRRRTIGSITTFMACQSSWAS